MRTKHPRRTREVGRRRFLRTAGAIGAGLALGVGGRGAVEDATDLVEVNVGYATPAGLDTALGEATELLRQFAFDALTLRLPAAVLEPLSEHAGVRYVEPNATKRLLDAAGTDRPQASSQRLPAGVERIDATVAHEAGCTGEGATVAVLDTGIASGHPDLRPNLGTGTSVVESTDDGDATHRTTADTPPWQDLHGHGTHCAGIIGAVDNERGVRGVAPDATIRAVKVGSASSIETAAIAAGIEYVTEADVDVANLSFGNEDPSELVADACRYATERGVVLVGAAGNAEEGEDNSAVRFPAAYDDVLAVSAVTNDGGLASYSLTGPEVDLAAPGDEVLSTVPGDEYGTDSGTSMAAPHVAGAAALLMADGRSPAETYERLAETAEDVGLDEDEQGRGVVDVAAALDLDD
jgi:subtilisin